MLLVAGGSGLIRVSWHDPCNRSGSPPTPASQHQLPQLAPTTPPCQHHSNFAFLPPDLQYLSQDILWLCQRYQRRGPRDMFKPINCVVYKIIRQNHINALVRGAHKAAPYGQQAVRVKMFQTVLSHNFRNWAGYIFLSDINAKKMEARFSMKHFLSYLNSFHLRLNASKSFKCGHFIQNIQ